MGGLFTGLSVCARFVRNAEGEGAKPLLNGRDTAGRRAGRAGHAPAHALGRGGEGVGKHGDAALEEGALLR